MVERRKALHERLANETLFDLTSTVKCSEKWEEKELQDVASALHYPLELYNSDSKFCNVFKDLLDAKVAVLNKRKWSNCIETHEAGKSWVAKTPSLREVPTALETIVSGVELVLSPQKKKVSALAGGNGGASACEFFSDSSLHRKNRKRLCCSAMVLSCACCLSRGRR